MEPVLGNDNITDDVFLDLYLKLDANEIANIAHQSKDMIRKCSIRGQLAQKKCKELIDGTQRVHTPTYGVCYIFNMVQMDAINNALISDNAGPNNGLMLEIDVEGIKRNTIKSLESCSYKMLFQ